ncbi:NAD(P)H-binding protein [Melioribacter sp. Ez-97]|uniref:NAD(P)H-binding protein n=1 Tax=Melioribacter sp. Ez-97 TaxID=3423434 RepID=UPI003ED9259D
MKALVIGATGATGKNLLGMALKDDYFTKVDIFVRRNVSLSNEKLTVRVIDFDKPDEWEKNVTGDVLFSCLGTTRRDAGGKKAQWKVDYDYQYRFAKAASENGVRNYVLVSSDLASSKSIFFYTKMKGKLEGVPSEYGTIGCREYLDIIERMNCKITLMGKDRYPADHMVFICQKLK